MKNEKHTQIEENLSEYNVKGYLGLLISQKVSILGSGVVQFAIIWWINQIYDKAVILSIASAIGLLPAIIILPFAGVICDRLNKKKIIIFTDGLQALATFGLIIAFWFNSAGITHVYILLAIRSLMQGLQMPVSMSIMSLMVPPKKYQKLNSVNSFFNSILNIVSPALGGIAIAFFDIENILWLDVVTFLPAALVLLNLYIPRLKEQTEEGTTIHFIKDIKESTQFLTKSGMFSFILFTIITNICINPLLTLIAKLIEDYHEGTAIQYSGVMTALQIGMFAATIILMLKKDTLPKLRKLLYLSALITLLNIGFYFVPKQDFWIMYIIMGTIGFVVSFTDVLMVSLLQASIPPEMQGRIFSSFFTIIKSLNPLAMILWGLAADATSIRFIYLLAPGISILLSVALMLFTPLLKLDLTKTFAVEDKKTNNQKSSNVAINDSDTVDPIISK